MCEYPDENGNLVKKNYNPGELLTSFGVFFGTVSLRTLSANTECEVSVTTQQNISFDVGSYL